ncbi:unnamed protein product [Urochloa humidicola]
MKRSRTKRKNTGNLVAAAVAAASASAAMEAEEEVTLAPPADAKEHSSLAIRPLFRTPCTTAPSLVHPKVPNVHECAGKIVRGATKFVLGLSSHINGTLLRQCSGFLIDWSENSRSGTVFTSAHLICSNAPFDEWSGEQVYVPDAEVRVHLDDDVAVKGQLMYYHEHYGFALIGVHMDRPPAMLASFSSEEVRLVQDVFVLGRDEKFYFQISNGRVNYAGPSLCQRYHYMYIKGGETPDCCTGGPVVDFDGVVMGMQSHDSGFVPCSILSKCLHLWRRFGCVPRIHLGLKLSSIKFLGICPRSEKIYRMSDIVDTGLIVEEVSAGSVAEKQGIRKGDIVKSLNGRCVDTTTALENLLMGICIDHFDKGHGLDSSIDVTVGMFFTCGSAHGTTKLTAFASNDVEIFSKGTYTVFDNEEEHSTSTSSDEGNVVDIW